MSEDELMVEDHSGGDPAQIDNQGSPTEKSSSGARLILKRSGAETEEVFPLNPPSIVGRFDPAVGPIDVDLGSLPEASYISRKHAKITHEDGVWTVHDLGSSNGTFVLRSDFERVEEAEIHDGDEIAFGNARFVFRISGGDVEAAPESTNEGETATSVAETDLDHDSGG